jgi:hypothetical protein
MLKQVPQQWLHAASHESMRGFLSLEIIFTHPAHPRSVKRLLRYNKYQCDPAADGKPSGAIAARYDLMPIEVSRGWSAGDEARVQEHGCNPCCLPRQLKT